MNRWLQKIKAREPQFDPSIFAHQYVENEQPKWIEWNVYGDQYFAGRIKRNVHPKSIGVIYDGELCYDNGKGIIETKDGKLLATVDYLCGMLYRESEVADFTVSYECEYVDEAQI